MDNQPNSNDGNFRVGKTIPSRPGKLTIIGLIGVVVAFFAVVLTAEDIGTNQKAPQSAGSTTQSR